MRLERSTIVTYGVLLLTGAASVSLPSSLPSARATPMPAGNTMRLTGTIRDFRPGTPDFGITDAAAMGHYVHNISPLLAADRAPTFIGGGTKVTGEWYDSHGRPIMPYGDNDPGLPGGHFDVDVYNKLTNKQLYHKHQFDDAYNVTYIDVAHDTKLLFASVVPATYPHDLRLQFMNPVNGGGGTYRFQAGGALMTGSTAAGFTATFTRSQLSQLRVDFVALSLMRGTTPGDSHADVPNRDGAFGIRMYDVVTNVMVYEIATYHHISGHPAGPPPPPPVVLDGCGHPMNDTFGTYGGIGFGAITSATSFSNWFHDTLGTNLSAQQDITLTRDSSGVYEYATNDFYPIDGRLFGNGGSQHNNLFTYTISASFVYHACTGQFFEFQGNDDAWVFINGRLVTDIGGAMTPARQYVALDRLGLVDGQRYPLDFFYAQRRSTSTSLFDMRTNLDLSTSSGMTMSAGCD